MERRGDPVQFGIQYDEAGRIVGPLVCQSCGAALVPELDETYMDLMELHAEWHGAMRQTAFETREELRRRGFEI